VQAFLCHLHATLISRKKIEPCQVYPHIYLDGLLELSTLLGNELDE